MCRKTKSFPYHAKQEHNVDMGTRFETCNICGSPIPSFVVVDGKKKQLQRRSCLVCVPFKSGKGGRSNGMKLGVFAPCKRCARDKGYVGTYCKTCVSTARRIKAKLKAIDLLGGKCQRCGWNKHPAGFEFHHPNGDKDFALGNFWSHKWSKLLPEIMKCELVCSCCHRIEHSTRFDEFVEERARSQDGQGG